MIRSDVRLAVCRTLLRDGRGWKSLSFDYRNGIGVVSASTDLLNEVGNVNACASL